MPKRGSIILDFCIGLLASLVIALVAWVLLRFKVTVFCILVLIIAILGIVGMVALLLLGIYILGEAIDERFEISCKLRNIGIGRGVNTGRLNHERFKDKK